jgi:hypothetical protein
VVPGGGSGVAAGAAGRSAGDAAAPGGSGGTGVSGGTGGSSGNRGPSGAGAQGSLGRAAFWTVLTSVLPGTGLVTTRLRVLGWVLFGLLVLAVGGGAIWYATSGGGFTAVLGLAKYLTSRTILIVIVALLVLVALVWPTTPRNA